MKVKVKTVDSLQKFHVLENQSNMINRQVKTAMKQCVVS